MEGSEMQGGSRRGELRTSTIPPMIAKSAAMQRFHDRLKRFAPLGRPVVLLGERGTGKTTFAGLLHTHSPRARGPFVHVNLASLSEGIMLTELFGHVKGAYTSAFGSRPGLLRAAAGGTVLLDEIGKASREVQCALLPVLDRGLMRQVGSDREEPIDVRLVFACNEDLDELVRSKTMLADFRDRLGFFRARVPSLRERKEDLRDLAQQLLARAAAADARYEGVAPQLTPGVLRRLTAYDWPGNVRELESLCERLIVDAAGSPLLDESLLTEELSVYAAPRDDARQQGGMPTLAAANAAIAECGGNATKAALKLGIGRTSLYRIMGAKHDRPVAQQPPA